MSNFMEMVLRLLTGFFNYLLRMGLVLLILFTFFLALAVIVAAIL